jgi:malate dehydrogenase (oxaloacetate-decarboxylating)(NADP+)
MNSFVHKLSPVGHRDLPAGTALLSNSILNKGTAFSEEERDALGIRGLLPPRVFTMAEQVVRALGQLRRKPNDLEKYIFLTTLQHRNETLFYRLLLDHLEELMPIIYTPTVGQACLEYGSIFRKPRGLWLTRHDKGHLAEVLRHWPHRGVRMIVVTDGERILGLGDLGALGMGIPIGKLSLYTACAGLHPYYCLPITIDLGTDNPDLLKDPSYIGLPEKRLRGEPYSEFLEEFVEAVQKVFPGALLQFEDFGNANAFRLLHHYQNRICCFNDDIQGTAAVSVAGLMAATHLTGRPLKEEKVLFYGAGEAGTGIGELLVEALEASGIARDAARKQCWFFDSKGLLVKNRGDKIAHHKAPFAHEAEGTSDLLEAVRKLRPTALVGVAGAGPAFTREIVEAMAEINPRPIIFALSNPTSKAECTALEAYSWTHGRAIFTSGSPFAPVTLNGVTHVPGQCNNVYVFPGVGLGVLACGASTVTQSMFLAAARVLADCVGDNDLAMGRVYPDLKTIRNVSLRIALAVAEDAYRLGVARRERPADLEGDIRSQMFEPSYRPYI